MAPGSSKTYNSRSTIKTTSDVYDVLETKRVDTLREAKRIARKESGKDSKLGDEVIAELESPIGILKPLTSVPESLLKVMFDTNAYLGGIQATSFQYAICSVLDAPWDFFCSSRYGKPESFVTQLGILTLSEKIEHIKSAEGDFEIHIYRKSLNGTRDPITMRVFVCDDHPLQSVLDMKSTHQQSAMSAVGTICFWPNLLSSKPRQYRAFEGNGGLNKYPVCKSKFRNRHTKIAPASSILHTGKRVYSGLDCTDTVMFDNVVGVPRDAFMKRQDEMKSIVYAVSTNSTKYLGHTAGM
jgi:hypothetical protein